LLKPVGEAHNKSNRIIAFKFSQGYII